MGSRTGQDEIAHKRKRASGQITGRRLPDIS
jgi:hypothetical protein